MASAETGGRERLLGSAQSICPHCRTLLDATLVVRDGRFALGRECPVHGRIEAAVYGDADRYPEIQRFNKSGESPLVRQTEVAEGCPRDCGICPEPRRAPCAPNPRCPHENPELRGLRHGPEVELLLRVAGG